MTNPTQLTIEHLSAYLPYGVKLKENSGMQREFLLRSIGYYPENGRDLVDVALRGMVLRMYYEEFKPILRPISQLTVPITHNGETFEPMERLKSEMPYSIEIMLSSVSEINPNDTPYGIVTRCLSWHFDVFGLIEAGLAVAMNPDGTIAQ